jgi:hypothetical protein
MFLSKAFQTTCCRALRWALLCGSVALVLGARVAALAEDAAPVPLPLQAALTKARVNGKYALLLAQLKAPQDYARYAEFRDLGLRELKEYAGVKELPRGHWVYVYPYWYIWRDLTSEPRAKRAWGPEQATGEPDTAGAGDIQTAWASLTPDGQDEWLLLEYSEPVAAEAVLVHETCSPGALTRITAFKLDGQEVELWRGKDPTPVGTPRGVSEIAVKTYFKTNRIKLYLNSKDVPGYNEIDAVGLRDSTGKMQWATAAAASSTYADQQQQQAQANLVLVGGAMPRNNAQDQRIQRLEAEVKELKETVKELQETIKKLKK